MPGPVSSKSYPLPLCSKLADWLSGNPQHVATAQQWLDMLRNQNSLRREEIERSGILASLQGHYQPSDRVRKDDLMAGIETKLSQCRPTVQSHWQQTFRPTLDVKIITNKRPKRVEPRVQAFVDQATTCYQHPSIGYWIIRTGYQDLVTQAPNWIVLDDQGKLLNNHERHRGWFPTAIEAFDEMHRVIRERFKEFGRERPNTTFDEYAFMGGKNYQEWFVRLPNWPQPYRDGHFDIERLLIHIRTTERIDDDGEPLFMVEEIQSPWHADIRRLRREIDADENENAEDIALCNVPFAKDWHELAIKASIWLAIKQGHTRVGFTTGTQQCDRWWDMEGLMRLYDQLVPKSLKKVAALFNTHNGWATINTRTPTGRIARIGPTEWQVQDGNHTMLTPPLKNKDVALVY